MCTLCTDGTVVISPATPHPWFDRILKSEFSFCVRRTCDNRKPYVQSWHQTYSFFGKKKLYNLIPNVRHFIFGLGLWVFSIWYIYTTHQTEATMYNCEV